MHHDLCVRPSGRITSRESCREGTQSSFVTHRFKLAFFSMYVFASPPPFARRAAGVATAAATAGAGAGAAAAAAPSDSRRGDHRERSATEADEQWFVRGSDGLVRGPYRGDALRFWVSTGDLQPHHPIAQSAAGPFIPARQTVLAPRTAASATPTASAASAASAAPAPDSMLTPTEQATGIGGDAHPTPAPRTMIEQSLIELPPAVAMGAKGTTTAAVTGGGGGEDDRCLAQPPAAAATVDGATESAERARGPPGVAPVVALGTPPLGAPLLPGSPSPDGASATTSASTSGRAAIAPPAEAEADDPDGARPSRRAQEVGGPEAAQPASAASPAPSSAAPPTPLYAPPSLSSPASAATIPPVATAGPPLSSPPPPAAPHPSPLPPPAAPPRDDEYALAQPPPPSPAHDLPPAYGEALPYEWPQQQLQPQPQQQVQPQQQQQPPQQQQQQQQQLGGTGGDGAVRAAMDR